MPRSQFRALALVVVGGATGTVLRALALMSTTPRLTGELTWTSYVPWRLLGINTLGVFLAAYALSGPLADPRRVNLRVLLLPGLLGGLTSYSALIGDAHALWSHNALAAVTVVTGAVAAGVLAGLCGRVVAR